MCDQIGCNSTGTDLPLPVASDAERRAFLIGAAALPLATVLAWPDLARASAAGLSPVSIDTKAGGKATGVVALPAKLPAPAVLLIHEWWGLNDQIKAVAAEYTRQGYIALAIDLYDGKVATTRDDARSYMQSVNAMAASGTSPLAEVWR